MKLIRSEASKLKYQALFFLRIKQRCYLMATECGMNSSDALGVNEKKMIEIEVKTNMTDLKADFKKNKHNGYKSLFEETETGDKGWAYQRQWVPNQFYFAVPTSMVEETKAFLDGKGATYYGILALADPDKDGELKVARSAKALHKTPPNMKVKLHIALRMGSELLRFHEAWL